MLHTQTIPHHHHHIQGGWVAVAAGVEPDRDRETLDRDSTERETMAAMLATVEEITGVSDITSAVITKVSDMTSAVIV